MTNSTFIKNNFKSSTLPRLKEFTIYSSIKKIDSCKTLTEVLSEMPSNYSQEDLFDRLGEKLQSTDFWETYLIQDTHKRIDEMSYQQKLELAELLGIK